MALALALAGCSAAPVSDGADAASHEVPKGIEPGPLDGQFWRLSAVDRGPLAGLAHARTVTLGFGEGRAFGYAGCNRYFSSYTLSGDRLDLGPAGSTMMYCEGEGSAVERAFLPLLEQPLMLLREGERMRLVAPDGTRLEFEAAPMEARYR
jgi:heat shock protein HslJ